MTTYSPPLGNAVPLQLGDGAYTPPAGDAVALAQQDVVAGNVAEGFKAFSSGAHSVSVGLHQTGGANTAFGTPLVAKRVFAVGFKSSEFPRHGLLGYYGASSLASVAFGTPGVLPKAVGFLAAHFGLPTRRLPAAGFSTAAFGAARIYGFFQHRQLPPSTVFGAPDVVLPQSVAVRGAMAARFGRPVAWRFGVGPGVLLSAVGGRHLSFGTPSVPSPRTAEHQGWRVSYFGYALASSAMFGVIPRFGTARTANGVAASGFAETAFGTHGAGVGLHATSAGGALFGATAVLNTGHAIGAQTPRFGRHTAANVGAHDVYPMARLGRFAVPKAWSRFNRRASGMQPTAFGAPACTARHNARSAPPSARFGRAEVRREGAC